jgi:metal-responsive CopG/Arc/MetJ family transcriptional regulator
MKVVQIVMDEKTLRAADRAAKRAGMNRSQLVREAVRAYLARSSEKLLDERHRRAYEKSPVAPGEFDVWESEQAWPED